MYVWAHRVLLNNSSDVTMLIEPVVAGCKRLASERVFMPGLRLLYALMLVRAFSPTPPFRPTYQAQ